MPRRRTWTCANPKERGERNGVYIQIDRKQEVYPCVVIFVVIHIRVYICVINVWTYLVTRLLIYVMYELGQPLYADENGDYALILCRYYANIMLIIPPYADYSTKKVIPKKQAWCRSERGAWGSTNMYYNL